MEKPKLAKLILNFQGKSLTQSPNLFLIFPVVEAKFSVVNSIQKPFMMKNRDVMLQYCFGETEL